MVSGWSSRFTYKIQTNEKKKSNSKTHGRGLYKIKGERAREEGDERVFLGKTFCPPRASGGRVKNNRYCPSQRKNGKKGVKPTKPLGRGLKTSSSPKTPLSTNY